MSVLEWKKFNFFDLVVCSDLKKIKNTKAKIVAQCYNISHRIFCDENGNVNVFFRNWDCVSFKAHTHIIKRCSLTSSNLLIILSQDNYSNEIAIKVFNLQKLSKQNGAPCIGNGRTDIPKSPVTVLSSFQFDSQICIAIGLEKGGLIFHRGTIGQNISISFRVVLPCLEAITGIEFQQKGSLLQMFVCSHSGVFCFTITENNAINYTKTVLESKMKPIRCCALQTIDSNECYFIVGSDDALYCFTNERLGPCYAIEGKKESIVEFRNHLVILIQSQMALEPHQSNSNLIVIDIQNKLIVFTKDVDNIQSIFTDNENCYLLTKDYDVLMLNECDIQNKLNLLMKKNLFIIALHLVENNPFNDQYFGQINLKYGDYLLQKGDIASAIDKYIETIGYIDPYNVIRKLLDSRYNNHLVQYLRALAKTEHKTEEYLELLQNCVERIELPSKIDQVYDDRTFEGKKNSSKFPNYTSKSELNDILDINTSSFAHLLGNEELTLNFLRDLDENKIFEFFSKNVQYLMANYPQETTNILKRITKPIDGRTIITNPEIFIPLLMTNDNCCIDYLENIIQSGGKCTNSSYNFLMELYLRKWQANEMPTTKIMDFITKNIENLSLDHVYILCKNYSFDTGLIYLHEKQMGNSGIAEYFTKSNDLNMILKNYDKIEGKLLSHKCIEILKNTELDSEKSYENVSQLLNILYRNGKQSILQIIQTVASNPNILVMHVREFLSNRNLHNNLDPVIQRETVSKLTEEKKTLDNLLENFKRCPIEFRSSICHFCRDELKLPAIYFLCQHSFHKECIGAYSESNKCIKCVPKWNTKDAVIGENNYLPDPTVNPLEYVAAVIGSGCIGTGPRTETIKISKPEIQSTTQPIWRTPGSEWQGRFSTKPKPAKGKNPFDTDTDNTPPQPRKIEEYDANLDPFNE